MFYGVVWWRLSSHGVHNLLLLIFFVSQILFLLVKQIIPHATITNQPGAQFKVYLPVFLFKHNGMTTFK